MCIFTSSRWLSPRESRGPLQWKIPCDPETGLGTLLHRVALLGHPVREKLSLHILSARLFTRPEVVQIEVQLTHCFLCYLPCGFRVKRFVAMKVVKSAEHYTETAVDEIKLLRSVSWGVVCTQQVQIRTQRTCNDQCGHSDHSS